jgi:hypothetical protein
LVFLVLRWLVIGVLVVYAARKRSLTTWILVAIVAGAEVGHDFPSVGTALRLVSQIFLRLIRTIIAPLILSTLVVGIAGHSDLRQVGRMGVKALIYFEIVTTFALLIGWGRRQPVACGRGREPAAFRGIAAAATAAGRAHVADDRASTSFPRTSRNRSPTIRSCRSWCSP